MRKFLLGFTLLIVMAACSDADSKDTYTIEDAKENGDVIVEHGARNFDQIVAGEIDVQNAGKVLELIESKEEAEVEISIFEQDGTHYKNTLSTDGEGFTFENNYGGYPQSPTGTFSCKYMSERGPVIYMGSCTSDDGTEVSTMIGMVGSEEAFRQGS
ncbi:hypothetical protein [Thalassobacillus hwangdonensis]|uniref:DUF4362 domain-containing protein n=1 Tax=Thalassobacillus hwangdonensis TaxID=546108 RepID=A0ABW3L0Z3_9BACI